MGRLFVKSHTTRQERLDEKFFACYCTFDISPAVFLEDGRTIRFHTFIIDFFSFSVKFRILIATVEQKPRLSLQYHRKILVLK